MYPFTPYKISGKFKGPTDYASGGLHEGIDFNVQNTWGDQDCGTIIKCVYPGTVVHSHNATNNYGNLVVVECDTPRGTRWVRYCHLDERVVSSGPVKQGVTIGTMGSTGNSTACHLHLDVLKKKPSNWRLYSTDIDQWFEDPEIIINDIITQPIVEPIDQNTAIDFNGLTAGNGYETYHKLTVQEIGAKLVAKDIKMKSDEETIAILNEAINDLKKELERIKKQIPPPDQGGEEDQVKEPSVFARLIAWLVEIVKSRRNGN